MTGREVVAALKKKFTESGDAALASKIGMTPSGIRNWERRKSVTSRQIAGLVHKAGLAGARNMQASAIRPLVEFFQIARADSKQGAKYILFETNGEDGKKHQYLEGLRKELDSHYGVYIFFDSRGQAIYTGKARRQTLWKEMNGAFNRPRVEVQTIKRVKHPTRNQVYKTSKEKARQITDYAVPLHELAEYVSAYEVTDGMIGEVEALLVRSFANDLLNIKMERFGQQRRAKRKKSA